jgi:hypothetical protein
MNPSELIKSVLPWIGTALGGPLGGLAATFVGEKLGLPGASIDAVKSMLGGMTPEKLAELKAMDQEFQLKMATLQVDSLYKMEQLSVQAYQSEVAAAVAVNATMQAEAAAEHWPTYSWRPAIGFAVAFNLVSASIVVFIAYLFKPSLVSNIPEMLTAQAALNGVAMPILGIASWFRGKAQAGESGMPVTVSTTKVTTKG